MVMSFIPQRPVQHRFQALPSARVLAKQLDINMEEISADSYLKKEHIHKHLMSPPKGKCEHISMSLDCMVGGFGNLQCMSPDYHKKCRYKERVNRILYNRDRMRKMF